MDLGFEIVWLIMINLLETNVYYIEQHSCFLPGES